MENFNRIKYCSTRKGGTRKTHEEFCREVKELVGDEYTVLGTYVNTHTKILMRHNKCCCDDGVHEWYVEPNLFLRGSRCPEEMYVYRNPAHYPISQEEFEQKLKKIDSNLSCVSKYVNSRTKVKIHCDGCGQDMAITPINFSQKDGCPYCHAHKLQPGINDLATTHPFLASCIVDPAFAQSHTYMTNAKTEIKCPVCGNITRRLPSEMLSSDGCYACPRCKDGVSFPEKFVMDIFRQLNIKTIFQLNKHYFQWCKNYRYDIYVPDCNAIIEVNGRQHYYNLSKVWPDVQSIQANDRDKRNLALNNGISNYIEIDVQESTLQYLHDSVLKSSLSSMFDLSKIDWQQCARTACKSRLIKACNGWENGVMSIQAWSRKLGMPSATVSKYLEKGASLGLCDYNYEEHMQKLNHSKPPKHCKPVYCHELNLIIPTIKNARSFYGLCNPNEVCGDLNQTSGGYHWSWLYQLTPEIIRDANKIDKTVDYLAVFYNAQKSA